MAEATTRLKDYYDVYSIMSMSNSEIYRIDLRIAVLKTFTHQDSLLLLETADQIINQISRDQNLEAQWKKYKNDHSFVGDISYKDVLEKIIELLKICF